MTEAMTDRPDIAAIEARANAAPSRFRGWRSKFADVAEVQVICEGKGDARKTVDEWVQMAFHARTDILALVAEVKRLRMYCREAAVQAEGMAKVCEKYAADSGITGALSRTMKEVIETAEFMRFIAEGNDGTEQWESEIKKRVDLTVAAAVAKERDAERERCAKVCDAVEAQQDNDHGAANTGGAAECAAAIRAAR